MSPFSIKCVTSNELITISVLGNGILYKATPKKQALYIEIRVLVGIICNIPRYSLTAIITIGQDVIFIIINVDPLQILKLK